MNRADGATVVGFAKLGPFIVRHIWRHPSNREHRFAALGRAALTLVSARVTGSAVAVPIGEHSQVLIHPRLHGVGSAKPLYGNPPDYYEMSLLRAALDPGALFVDVGANIGTYSIIAAESGAQVVAIEASSDGVRVLRTNVRLNDIGTQVEVVHAAAGSGPGTVRMSIGLDTLNHVLAPDAAQTEATESVAVVTLDAVVGPRYVAAMKIDVEGFEADVLAGATSLLADRRVSYIQLENNQSARSHFARGSEPVWDQLRAAGYTLFGLDPDSGTVWAEQSVGRLIGREVIAVAEPGSFWDRVRDRGFAGTVSKA